MMLSTGAKLKIVGMVLSLLANTVMMASGICDIKDLVNNK